MTMSTSVTQHTEIRASGQLSRWRTIDLLTCAFLGVAFGVAYWAWGLAYQAPSNAVTAVFPPLGALFAWPWLVAGIVGMLVIRRPGAAVFTELLAATVSALIGTQWGLTTLVSGLVQGLGVELGFAAFGYATFRWGPLLLGGFLGGAFEAVYEWYSYWQEWGTGYRVAYLFLLGGSVAIFGSLLAVALTRGLAAAGALNAFPPGQEARERHAV
ncbi:ECF transporter S component [Intrasporangium sp.]|jgi:energy-coupling factor transport system substrate-specific component|uniref:ECF transporter S component n=1 Tax=Intrasporangium sp. TaxID=1925024 RepID=UPI003365848C